MKGSFVLLWLESPVLYYHPGSFNVEMRAQNTVAHSMLASSLFLFLPGPVWIQSKNIQQAQSVCLWGIYHGYRTSRAVSASVWVSCGNKSTLLRPATVSPPRARSFIQTGWMGKRRKERETLSKERQMQLQKMHGFKLWRLDCGEMTRLCFCTNDKWARKAFSLEMTMYQYTSYNLLSLLTYLLFSFQCGVTVRLVSLFILRTNVFFSLFFFFSLSHHFPNVFSA